MCAKKRESLLTTEKLEDGDRIKVAERLRVREDEIGDLKPAFLSFETDKNIKGFKDGFTITNIDSYIRFLFVLGYDRNAIKTRVIEELKIAVPERYLFEKKDFYFRNFVTTTKEKETLEKGRYSSKTKFESYVSARFTNKYNYSIKGALDFLERIRNKNLSRKEDESITLF